MKKNTKYAVIGVSSVGAVVLGIYLYNTIQTKRKNKRKEKAMVLQKEGTSPDDTDNLDTTVFPLSKGDGYKKNNTFYKQPYVLNVQEWLNNKSNIPLKLIPEDGYWGDITQKRFEKITDGKQQVTESMYKNILNELANPKYI